MFVVNFFISSFHITQLAQSHSLKMTNYLVLAANISTVNMAASIALRPPGREDAVFDVSLTLN